MAAINENLNNLIVKAYVLHIELAYGSITQQIAFCPTAFFNQTNYYNI
jgi:hypothetical protein